MIPDYQTLMRPVLECASSGEARISDVVESLANKLGLTAEERGIILPSGKQTRFANRVNWAKSYLKQGGLVEITGRGRFKITERGRAALADKSTTINNAYLAQFEEFQSFKSKETDEDVKTPATQGLLEEAKSTPDEALRRAHGAIISALSAELLDRVRNGTPEFFETLIVQLLIAMGYGGTSEEAGRAIGQSGDNGVDGVIDQDPLGVDQIYVQAKRYGEGNNIAAGAIRDFYGALSLKRAHKGIFVTTSAFSPAATETARGLGSRIVRELWSRALAAASVEIRGGALRRLEVAQDEQVRLLRQEVAMLRDRLQREAQAYGELRAQNARHEVIAKDALSRCAEVERRHRDASDQVGFARSRIAELEARLRMEQKIRKPVTTTGAGRRRAAAVKLRQRSSETKSGSRHRQKVATSVIAEAS